MKKATREFEFKLETGIKYHYQGDEINTFKLLLKAPGNIHSRFCSKLTKAFFTSAQNMAAQNTNRAQAVEDTDSSLDSSSIVLAMKIGGDMDEIYELFREFMTFSTANKTGSICLLDGNEPMTSAVYDRMQLDDTDRLLGEYIKNFLIPVGL